MQIPTGQLIAERLKTFPVETVNECAAERNVCSFLSLLEQYHHCGYHLEHSGKDLVRLIQAGDEVLLQREHSDELASMVQPWRDFKEHIEEARKSYPSLGEEGREKLEVKTRAILTKVRIQAPSLDGRLARAEQTLGEPLALSLLMSAHRIGDEKLLWNLVRKYSVSSWARVLLPFAAQRMLEHRQGIHIFERQRLLHTRFWVTAI